MLLKNPVFRTFVFALTGMVVVFFLVSFMLADRWAVNNERWYDAPVERVEPLLRDLHRWQEWSGWQIDLGAGAQRSIEGEPGEVGHRVVWISDQGGATLRFAKVGPGRIDYEFLTRRPGATDDEEQVTGWGYVAWRAEREGTTEGTTVEWGDACDLSEIGAPWIEQMVARWFLWFGALQEYVRQTQEVSLNGLQRALGEPAAAEAPGGGASTPKDPPK